MLRTCPSAAWKYGGAKKMEKNEEATVWDIASSQGGLTVIHFLNRMEEALI